MLSNLKISLERASLAEQVFEHIRKMILSEQLKGGERIPEEKIASAFGVSRTPIREALRMLEKQGLVVIVPRSHAEVVALDGQASRRLGEVRIQLERLAVRLLAEVCTAADCEVLTDLALECERYAREGAIAEAFEKDDELHLEIARRGGNQYLCDILQNLSVKIHLLRITNCVTLDKIRETIKGHSPIVQALAGRDAKSAEEHMTAHIRSCIASLSETNA